MVRRHLTPLLVSLLVAGASTVPAQNILPNPDFDTAISPWSGDFETAVWDAVDSNGCPGSGALELPCSFSDQVLTGACLPYSVATARIAYALRASSDVPGTEQFGVWVAMYSDLDCQAMVGSFPIFVGSIGDVPATFQTFESSQVLAVGTQSVKVSFGLSDNNCEPGMSFFLDALYYGEGHRIVAHDFESGDPCPFVGIQ